MHRRGLGAPITIPHFYPSWLVALRSSNHCIELRSRPLHTSKLRHSLPVFQFILQRGAATPRFERHPIGFEIGSLRVRIAAMDFESLKTQVSNLTLYDIKAGVRKVQNGMSCTIDWRLG